MEFNLGIPLFFSMSKLYLSVLLSQVENGEKDDAYSW